jgi:hypothetical protein
MSRVFVINGDGYAERKASCSPLLLMGFSHTSSGWRQVSFAMRSMPRLLVSVNTTVGEAGSSFGGLGSI